MKRCWTPHGAPRWPNELTGWGVVSWSETFALITGAGKRPIQPDVDHRNLIQTALVALRSGNGACPHPHKSAHPLQLRSLFVFQWKIDRAQRRRHCAPDIAINIQGSPFPLHRPPAGDLTSMNNQQRLSIFKNVGAIRFAKPIFLHQTQQKPIPSKVGYINGIASSSLREEIKLKYKKLILIEFNIGYVIIVGNDEHPR